MWNLSICVFLFSFVPCGLSSEDWLFFCSPCLFCSKENCLLNTTWPIAQRFLQSLTAITLTCLMPAHVCIPGTSITQLKWICPHVVKLLLMASGVLGKLSGLCRQFTWEYMSGRELKKVQPVLLGREKRDGGWIGLCTKTDARESRWLEVHLHNLGGKKRFSSEVEGGGEGDRSGKIK